MKNKSTKTMDAILILLGVMTLAFIVVMIWLYLLTGAIPDTLCMYYFIAVTGECGAMGVIKSFKEKYRDREWELEDRELKNKEIEENKNKTLKYLAEQEAAGHDRAGSKEQAD